MDRKEAIKRWQTIVEEMEAKKSELDNLLIIAKQSSEQTANTLSEANGKLNEITGVENQVSQKLQTIEQSRSNAAQKEDEAKNKFEAISQIQSEAEGKKADIERLESETEKLLEENNKQSDKISDLLQKAAAGSLFGSFNIRKGEHATGSRFWMWMVLGSVAILAGFALWFTLIIDSWVTSGRDIVSYEFLIKFSVSFPLIYWLVFSTKQYTKAKRLEEEYAFKSAISLSIEAYRDLIKRESGEPTKDQVIPFITEAVSKIFSSPSLAISEQPHKEDVDIVEGLLDKVMRIANKFKP